MSWTLSKETKQDIKSMVTCTICTGIITDPRQCNKCENNFCKKCIEEWFNRSNTCPFKCWDASFKESRQTRNILSSLHFECPIEYREAVAYDEIGKHKCREVVPHYKIGDNKFNQNIVVIGETGVGKSTLCNLLIGREKFIIGISLNPTTLEAKSAEGVFNGNPITVIDTQGYGHPQRRDTENTKQMINLVRNVKTAKAFLIVMNGQNIRWNEATWWVLTLFNNMYPDFWENVIFVKTFGVLISIQKI